MGNHIATVHWEHNENETQDIEYMTELANKYSISIIKDNGIDYYPGLNNFGVEYTGFWMYLVRQENVKMKLKCFLYDVSQYFNRKSIDYTTNLTFTPL